MANRLKQSQSLYLKQHENDPIHWWPYGPEAIQKAHDENRPIFLSIGYSSCHWCHVMGAESFSDQDTADIINEHFIAIKVDREEWPDIDQFYQTACQSTMGRGGWPLNAFLTPDMSPYFAGTYFSKKSTPEAASFKEVALEMSRAFREERESVNKKASEITSTILKGQVPDDKVEFQGHFPPPMAILDALKDHQDNENGGWGEAPKFPLLAFLEWAVEHMLEGKIDQTFGEHIIKTLDSMMLSGVFDQARGGLHRYSVTKDWKVPHFEKMLYDQAGLLRLLAKASLVYPAPHIFDGLMNTLDYLESEMLGEKKFFFSAQDSDSEGVEGLFFTYTEEEFCDALISFNEELEQDLDKLKEWFSISKEGNFDRGLNVLSLPVDKKETILDKDAWTLIRKAKEAIVDDRKMRVPPATDNKGVASWNFVMISALVDVMQYCSIDVIKQRANGLFNMAMEGAYENFLTSKETEKAFRIRHSTTMEEGLPYLEDYVFFADVQLRVYEVTGNPVFKENLEQTLVFLRDEFLNGDTMKTRAKTYDDAHLYPNAPVSFFDSSFRSASSSFIGLVRRSSVLFTEIEWPQEIAALMEKATHTVLKNPLGAGEALRSLTYPTEAYKKLRTPKEWVKNAEYVGLMKFFMPRFVLDYHEDDNQEWEISSSKGVELKGDGLEKLIETLRPNAK